MLWSPRALRSGELAARAVALGGVLLGSAATNPANSAVPRIKEQALRLPCETRYAARGAILLHCSAQKVPGQPKWPQTVAKLYTCAALTLRNNYVVCDAGQIFTLLLSIVAPHCNNLS